MGMGIGMGIGMGMRTGMPSITPCFAFPHHDPVWTPQGGNGMFESKLKGKTPLLGSKASFACGFALSVSTASHPGTRARHFGGNPSPAGAN